MYLDKGVAKMAIRDRELRNKHEDTVKEINRDAANQINRCNIGYEWIDKVQRLLPPKWRATYSTWGQINIHRKTDEGEKVSAVEFREVCQHVDRIIGPDRKLNRSASESGDGVSLKAYAYMPDGLSVQVTQGSLKCKITYKEEKVPAQPATTKKVAVVSEHCLGLRKPKEKQASA
jgi:hypothetical protein